MQEGLAVEVHEVKSKEAHVDGDVAYGNVLPRTVREGLEVLQLSAGAVDGHDLAFHDEAFDAVAADLGDQRNQVGVFIRHQLQVS